MGMFKGREVPPGRAMPPRDGTSLMAGCTLEGNFTFKGTVLIGAVIKGDIVCDGTVFIEPSGRVEGKLSAPEIIIQGWVQGNIAASRSMEVWPGAKLSGTVYSPSLRVDEGARVDADLIIALERPPVAHINKAPPDMENVTPLIPKTEADAPAALPAEAPAPRTMFTKAAS